MHTPKAHDKLAFRLGMILSKLNDGERLDKQSLAEEFNVSPKTVERDLHQRLSFLPIEKEKGYYYLPSYVLGKLSFHDIKAFAAFSGIKDLYPELTNDLIVDILNAKTSSTMQIRGLSYESLKHKLDAFNTLGGAMLAEREIAFDYKQKRREAQPYKLVNNDGIWYLVAVEAGVLKHFTFSKIENLTVSEESFEKDAAIEEILQNDQIVWFTQSPIEVIVEIDRQAAGYFLRRKLLPKQQLIEEREESLLFSCEVAFEAEIERIVRYWIPHIRIVSPEHLQKKLEEGLRGYLHNQVKI